MGANIKIQSESKQFITEMKQVTDNLKLVDSTLSVATEKAKLFGSTTEALKGQQAQLSNSLQGSSKILDLQGKTLTALVSDIDKYKSRNVELAKSITDVEAKLKESIKTTGEDSKETKDLVQELNKLQNEFNSNSKAMDKANSSIDKYKIKMNETEKAILQDTKALEELDKKIGTQKLEKFADATGKVGNAMTKLSVPIIGAGVASSKFAMDFEDGMAQISTVADTSKTSMANLGNGVKNLSNISGESFKTIQQGLYDTISSGVKTEDAMNFLTVAVKAAKGGFTDTATSVDALTSTLNAYGLEASKAGDIANQMLVAQNLGKTTYDQMAQSIGNVIPTSAALGVKTNELFSSLAVLTANGIKTSEAVTGLKAAMSNIIKPSDQASKAAASLGIDFSASAVATKGWLPFLMEVKEQLKQASPEFAKETEQLQKNAQRMTELTNAGKKNTQEYKNLSKQNKALTKDMEMLASMSDSPISAFSTMFGSVEGLNTALTLTSASGVPLYNESMKQMATNTTATDDAFKKINETSGAKFRNSINQAKNSMIGFGDAISPMITSVSGGISHLTGWFSNLNQGQKNVVVGIGAFIVSSGLSLTAISKVTNAVKDARDGIGLLKDGVKLLGDGFSTAKTFIGGGIEAITSFGKATGEALISVGKMTIELAAQAGSWIAQKIALVASTIATGAMTAAQAALNFVMSLNPLTVIIIGLTALVAGIVVAYNKVDWFRNMVNGAFTAIKNTAIWAFNGIKDFLVNWGAIILIPVAPFLGIPLTIMQHWGQIKEFFSNLGSWLKQKLHDMFSFELPHIKLPHFSLTGEFSLSKGTIPHLGVEWYAKGGIMTQPTVFGMNGNNAMVGGEAGAEAVLPLQQLWNQLDKNFEKLEQRLNVNKQQVFVIQGQDIYMDGQKVGRVTSKYVNQEMAWNG